MVPHSVQHSRFKAEQQRYGINNALIQEVTANSRLLTHKVCFHAPVFMQILNLHIKEPEQKC